MRERQASLFRPRRARRPHPVADGDARHAPTRHVRGIAIVLLAGASCGTVAADNAPASYAENLDLIRGASPRNTNHDGSPYRNTPQGALRRADHLGPRIEYLDTAGTGIIDGSTERHFPDAGGGQFRVSCEFSHFAYDDPLVHWGKPGAAHLHMFWGNTDVNAYSTYDTLINSGSSTCNGQELNRTGYWAPAMIDASGNARIPMRIVVYYKGYGNAKGRSAVYPEGAAMIAMPDLHRVSSNEGGVAGYGEFAFQCTDQFRGGSRTPAGNTIPVCDDVSPFMDVLEMHVKFPNCLVGDDPSDPASWRPSLAGGWFWSDCQDNLTTPNIEYIIQYPIGEGETTEGWYLASDVNAETLLLDKPGGTTNHADWWGGWEPGVNRTWIDECVNLDVGDTPSGCGMGYLSDGGPDNRNPLPGPALKLRPGYDTDFTVWGQPLDPSGANYTVPIASLYDQLCTADRRADTPAQAAYCTPSGGMDMPMPDEPEAPSEPDAPVDPAPAPPRERGTGLLGRYFDDRFFGTEISSRVDPKVNFNFTGRWDADIGLSESDTFSVEWQGYLIPDRSETVTLWTRSDDGVRVYLDGELIIDNWTDHAPTVDRAEVELVAGRPHAIAVQYYQNRGGASIRLGWTRPGRRAGVIPTRVLYPPDSGA